MRQDPFFNVSGSRYSIFGALTFIGDKKMRKFVGFFCLMFFVGLSAANASTITFNDFSNASAFTFNGSAKTINDVLRLTPSVRKKAGSAFLTDPISLGNKGSFSTNFKFQITNSDGDEGGADGLVFVIQTVSKFALGDTGGNMGYYGISPSIGIEFDTYKNSGDSNGNHIAINLNGKTGPGSVAYYDVPTNLNNGNIWYTWIDFDGTSNLMEVRLSESDSIPAEAQLSYALDVSKILDTSNVFAGFTSGTGGGYGNHDILSWEFKVVPIPSSFWLLSLGLIGIVGMRFKREEKIT